MKTTNVHKTKPNKTKSWFRSLLHHQETKWTRSIIQLPEPTQGNIMGATNLGEYNNKKTNLEQNLFATVSHEKKAFLLWSCAMVICCKKETAWRKK